MVKTRKSRSGSDALEELAKAFKETSNLAVIASTVVGLLTGIVTIVILVRDGDVGVLAITVAVALVVFPFAVAVRLILKHPRSLDVFLPTCLGILSATVGGMVLGATLGPMITNSEGRDVEIAIEKPLLFIGMTYTMRGTVRGAGPGEAVWLLISPDGEATTSSHGPCSLADESFTCEDASFGGIADGGKRYHARAVLVDHEGQDKLVRDMEFQPIAESKPVTVTRH